MLTRALPRSLSGALPKTLPKAALSSFQSRSYAKNKAKKAFEYKAPIQSPGNKRTPEPQKFSEPAAAVAAFRTAEATSTGVDNPGLPNIASLQKEYDDILRSQDLDQRPQHSPNGSTYDSLGSQDGGAPSSARPAGTQGQDFSHGPSAQLPDLTQGIPSTLDAEMAQASRKSETETLELTPEVAEAGGRGGGDLPKTAYISSLERRRNRFANYFYIFALSGVVFGTVLLGRNWETEEEERRHLDAPSGWGFGLFYKRASARLAGMLDYYNEPAFPKLLPDTDKAWERPYTLVLSLEDMLVHSEWDREHGWRLAKRPGVDYFLRYLSQYYELVIFTSTPSMTAQPIINKLDPYHIVMWPLFREATRYKNGQYIKDLEFLNRPLNKIIMIDSVPAHAANQPENAIILNKWKGNSNDKELVSLIPFLEYVASMEFNDTRDVIKSFEGTHIPTEFARREAIAREKFLQQLSAEKSKGRGRSMGSLGGVFGMRQPNAGDGMELSLSEGFAQGKTFQDQVRERGQKAYEMLEKEIRENGEKWLKEMAEEEKKATDEAMKGMKNSISSVIPFGNPGSNPPSSSASSSSNT